MPLPLSDLLWIFVKMVTVVVIVDLVLMYLIWRVRGINRAQEHRRRMRIKRRRQVEKSIWLAEQPTVDFARIKEPTRMEMHRADR